MMRISVIKQRDIDVLRLLHYCALILQAGPEREAQRPAQPRILSRPVEEIRDCAGRSIPAWRSLDTGRQFAFLTEEQN